MCYNVVERQILLVFIFDVVNKPKETFLSHPSFRLRCVGAAHRSGHNDHVSAMDGWRTPMVVADDES